jgi:capsular exopolysaccharide synthesis family protein
LRAALAGAAVGFMLGFAISYLAELADKCFRSPEEIRQTLGAQVLAHIPELSGDRKERKKGVNLHRTLAAFFAPKSRAAEAFRSVRTGLYFSTSEESHKAIQITSPEPSDGKTTLACNLAISIAQSGKQVLLIDADMRRPKVHRLFGVQENTRGLVTVLSGKDALEDALVGVPEVENLALLPSGPPPSNPAEILTSQAFENLIEACKARFDFVLVDTPPVLAVTDPTVVAPRVDGVIMAIRLDKNSRPKAVRAVETLSQINSKIIGIVVSGVGGSGDSGYGRYGYSGSYRYQAELLYGGGNAYYDAYYGREEQRPQPKK